MIIHRETEPHNKNYTPIDNRLFELPLNRGPNLSARAIFFYLLSRTERWETSRNAICYQLGMGLTTFNMAIRELRTFGLLKINKMPGSKDYIYTVYEMSDEISALLDKGKIRKSYKESRNKKETNEPSELLRDLQSQWETICYSCPKAMVLTREDEINLSKILNDHDFPVDKDYIIEQMKKIQNSDFATGNNDRGWKMTFSKFLSDFTGVINGKYDGKINNHSQNKGGNQFTDLYEKLESQRNEKGGFDL